MKDETPKTEEQSVVPVKKFVLEKLIDPEMNSDESIDIPEIPVLEETEITSIAEQPAETFEKVKTVKRRTPAQQARKHHPQHS